jgi:ribosomal protein S18 acetylase RimI-like enzyme
MTLLHVQILLQAVATLSLVGAFVYAGFQLRDHRKAQRVANFTKLVELQMELRRMRVEDPTLAAVYAHDVETFSGEREIREYFFNLMQLSVFEIVWFAHDQGQLPGDYFDSWRTRMQHIAREPSFQRMMRGTNLILHDDFQRYIEALVRESVSR